VGFGGFGVFSLLPGKLSELIPMQKPPPTGLVRCTETGRRLHIGNGKATHNMSNKSGKLNAVCPLFYEIGYEIKEHLKHYERID